MSEGADRMEKLRSRTRYDAGVVEQPIMAEWLRAGYFQPDAEGSAAENYSIAVPPPNVTGALHMGHALNGAIQDVLIRIERMRGRRAEWILGTDHAGIATQAIVRKQIESEGTSLEDLGRERFIERVWEWKREYGSTIVEQYKRLGASCDYGRERFTLDPGYQKAVYRVFKTLYDKGLIYRDVYMVNWDPGGQTAISDLEVEHREVEDKLYEVAYPFADGAGELIVATVRPETIPADTAVAVNPDDQRYADAIGRKVVLPLVGREVPVIADEHVDPKFGTGALKITPGHDPADFAIGRKHGLEEIGVIGTDGRMTAEAGRFAGMSVVEAREAVALALEQEGAMRRVKEYVHSVGHSHRSGRPIEPLVSEQWFLDMGKLLGPAIEAVEDERVRFVPGVWKRVCLDWMRDIRPWCISRQLWWGHRLPVWYCDACQEVFVSEETPERCALCAGALRQDTDVLDTWFSSALWPFATLGWPERTPMLDAFYPTDFLTTAREILFLWVARMIAMGLEFAGDVPFKDVYVHSVILAPDGRRMSKSLGTGIDPLELIRERGADALRFGLLAMSSSQDVRYSEEKVRQGQEFANKLWNASRLVLLNTDDVEPVPRGVDLYDRWILSRLQRAIKRNESYVGEYDFSHAVRDLYEFFWSDFCDWYLEVVKPRLYSDRDKARTSAVLLFVLREVLALVHPAMPFVTEEIYSLFPPRAKPTAHLAIYDYPEMDPRLLDEDAERRVGAIKEATQALRRYRERSGMAPSVKVRGRIVPDTPAWVAVYKEALDAITLLTGFELDLAGTRSDTAIATVPLPGASLDVLPTDGLDPDAVVRRRAALQAHLESEVRRAEEKLSNERFTAKAPAPIVEAEREKLAKYRKELSGLE